MSLTYIAILTLGAFLLLGIIWHLVLVYNDRHTMRKAHDELVFPETTTILELLVLLKNAYTQQMHGERRYGVFRYKNAYEFIFSGKNIALYGYSHTTQVKILIMQTAIFYSRYSSFDYIQIENPYASTTLGLIELLRDALHELGEEKRTLTERIAKDLEK